MYPSYVTYLHEDGHMCGRNMWEVFCVYNILSYLVQLRTFVSFATISNNRPDVCRLGVRFECRSARGISRWEYFVVILCFSCYKLGLGAYLDSDRDGSFHILSQ